MTTYTVHDADTHYRIDELELWLSSLDVKIGDVYQVDVSDEEIVIYCYQTDEWGFKVFDPEANDVARLDPLHIDASTVNPPPFFS